MTPQRALAADLVALAVGGVLLMAVGLPGWILLAGAGGIVATRGAARLVLSVVVAVVSIGLGAWAFGEGHLLGVAGSGLGAAAAAWAVLAGRTWPAMGGRYERTPAGDATQRRLSDWDSLDAGIDPTEDPGRQ